MGETTIPPRTVLTGPEKVLLLERYNVLGNILNDFSYNSAAALGAESLLPAERMEGVDMETTKLVAMIERIQTLLNTLDEDSLTDIIPTDEATYEAFQGSIPQDASFAQNSSTLTALYSGWLSIIRTKGDALKINYQLNEAEKRRAAAPKHKPTSKEEPAMHSEAWFRQKFAGYYDSD